MPSLKDSVQPTIHFISFNLQESLWKPFLKPAN